MRPFILTIPRISAAFLTAIVLISASSVISDSLVSLTDVPVASNVLLVSTLDGLLHAVDRQQGNILWTVREPPRLQVSSSQIGDRVFVTDPRDGGLYVIDAARNIQKFPKTVPELVGESPQKTSDGILITGKKTATWMAIDPRSGSRHDYQPEALSTCPIPTDTTVFIPRTEYVLSLLDSSRQHIWNVTYTQYGSSIKIPEISPDLILSSSNSGELLKMSSDQRTVLWFQKFSSPVVAIYSVHSDGSLRDVGHHVVVPQLIKRFLSDTVDSVGGTKHIVPELLKHNQVSTVKSSLDQMLFVGQHGANSVYCMPTILDRRTPKGEKMPPFYESVMEVVENTAVEKFLPMPGEESLLGSEANDTRENFSRDISTALSVHPEPKCIATVVSDTTIIQPLCTIESDSQSPITAIISPNYIGYHPFPMSPESERVQDVLPGLPPGLPPAILPAPSSPYLSLTLHLPSDLRELAALTVVLLVVGIVSAFAYRKFGRLDEVASRGSARSLNGSTGSQGSGTPGNSVHLSDTMFVVGKIHFDPTQLVGRGCDGTCVFRGQFDGRDVAVKRLLPDCFSFADREVALLKESDFHTNVIRYFATESDSQFRYIALELCQATLVDYVEHRETKFTTLTPKELLKQSMEGLSHLHKLNIVHRDIKPQNILLSYPTLHGHVRVLISDFGLCKKLSHERMSFSKVNSGILGTQGWIAPEMLDGTAQSASRSLDIFSMGCVFYYCLTDGHHPFGDNGFARQGNIVEGKWSLDYLKDDDHEGLVARHIITQMIQAEPRKRPGADCVLVHPFFWDAARNLGFLQDISDRIEKEDIASPIVTLLEKNAMNVVRWNWRQHICLDLQDDLKKFRSYRGGSVRDLLRAIRNKKHHYRELPEPVQKSLGTIPAGFVEYFCSRFPRLILHTYLAMQPYREDAQLAVYYSLKTTWLLLESPIDGPWRKKAAPSGDSSPEEADPTKVLPLVVATVS